MTLPSNKNEQNERNEQRALFVTGTDTEVGKTYVTAAIAAWCAVRRPHANVRVWKPIQSGAVIGDMKADSYVLRWANGVRESEQDIVEYSLPEPLAPWIAAQKAGVQIDFEQLVQIGLARAKRSDFLLAEGAGGLLVPLTARHTVADLIANLRFPALVVARAGLGTVNHTLLTVAKLKAVGVEVRGVILNGYRPDQVRQTEENAMMIERFGGVPVLGTLPWIEGKRPQNESEWTNWRDTMAELVEERFALERIIPCPSGPRLS